MAGTPPTSRREGLPCASAAIRAGAAEALLACHLDSLSEPASVESWWTVAVLADSAYLASDRQRICDAWSDAALSLLMRTADPKDDRVDFAADVLALCVIGASKRLQLLDMLRRGAMRVCHLTTRPHLPPVAAHSHPPPILHIDCELPGQKRARWLIHHHLSSSFSQSIPLSSHTGIGLGPVQQRPIARRLQGKAFLLHPYVCEPHEVS